ncbi:MAG: ABC transporter permease [Wenzhouxiangellaceae bacterium]
MFSHYAKIALRSLSREKSYAIINLLGLALAVTCSMILFLYVRGELTYDQHNVRHDRIYRIVNILTTNGQADRHALTSQVLAPMLENEYPQLGEFVRVRNLAINRNVLRHNDIELYWDDLRLADENIFDVFTHEAVYGDLQGSLEDPSSIVISERLARAYFGDSNPIGETLSTDTFDYQVTAVFKDLPENTHLKYNALLSMNRLRVFGITDNYQSPEQFFSAETYTYLLLDEGLDQAQLDRMLNQFYEKYMAPVGRRINASAELISQPLDEVHFISGYTYDQPTGNIFYVYGFIAVALFLVLVASINYTNLATARAAKRSKEIGMRKILGASKQQLINQFLGESVSYAVVAGVAGVILIFILSYTGVLSSLFGKTALFDITREPLLIVWIMLGAVIIGMIAGAYPSFYLANISPLTAITSARKAHRGRLSLRQALVFLQFFVSIGVIAATAIMAMQMNYVASKPLGFDRTNKIAVQLRGVEVLERISVMKNELLKHPRINGVAETTYVPGSEVLVNLIPIENDSGQMEVTSVSRIFAGQEFIDVMNIEIVDGRDFSKRLLTDVGTSVLVNETLVRKMGWDEPLGKRIQVSNSRVIGVMRDFHFRSLHEAVEPLMIMPFPNDALENLDAVVRNLVSRELVIDVDGEDMRATIEHIGDVVAEFDPDHPFEFRFFDDLLSRLYSNETTLINLTAIFAGICIFISCLGLYGLAAFTTVQRTKEIGIRKVLGASTQDIVLLLARSLLVLVLVAAVVASMVSYAVMKNWLSIFAYRTEISLWIFVLSTLVVALLAFITVTLQTYRTAQSNPINALRYE